MSSSVEFSADVLEHYLRQIYGGFDVEHNIEHRAWREILDTLNEGTVEGLAQSTNQTPQEAFLAEIRHSNEVFAAFKVSSMSQKLAEQLLDDKGTLKSFSQWKQDVASITTHYIGAWLQTEYDTAVIRAHQAADWQDFINNEDVMPNLRWMPTTSPNPEGGHRAFWERKLTLPVSDPFWDEHRPGDRYNCKCSLEATDDPIEPYVVDPSLPTPQPPHKGLENNPGKDGRLFSDKHPYFPESCSKCSFYKPQGAKALLSRIFAGRKKDCHNCPYINKAIDLAKIEEGKVYVPDKEYGERLLISIKADTNDLQDNIRVAKALLDSFPEMIVKIRPHIRIKGVPNPELEINDLIADNKKIEGFGGVSNGFRKAIEQECKAVVIDLDASLKRLDIEKLSKAIADRKIDFKEKKILECYVVYNGKSVKIVTHDRNKIREILSRIKEKG